jgi:WD40 repeat protein
MACLASSRTCARPCAVASRSARSSCARARSRSPSRMRARASAASDAASVGVHGTRSASASSGASTARPRSGSPAFSPNGQVLATGSFDGQVRLWDVATGQQIGGPLTDGSTASIDSVAFSTDGRTLAAGTYNGVVQLWNVSDLAQVMSALCATAGQTLTRAQWALYAAGPAYQNVCP